MTEMTSNSQQNWLQKWGPAKLVALYLTLLLTTASVWLTQGTAMGSLAGGACFGFYLARDMLFPSPPSWVDSIITPLGFVSFIGLHLWKVYCLMPVDWEPAGYFDIVGAGGCALAVGISIAVGWLRDPGYGLGGEVQPSEPNAESTQDGVGQDVEPSQPVPRTRLERAASALAIVALAATLIVNVAELRPDWISTTDIALSRYVVKSVYDFRSKKNLAYALASMTQVSVEATAVEGNTFTANLKVATPVVPFEVTAAQANTLTAMRKYFDLPSAQRPNAVMTGKVVFQRSGLGWIVSQETIDTNPVKLSQDLRAGRITPSENEGPQVPINLFGILDFATQPFNPIELVGVALLISFLMISSSRMLLFVVAGSALLLAMSYMPVLLVLTGTVA